MRRHFTFLFVFCLISNLVTAQYAFNFIENLGQWDDPFDYRCDVPGGALFINEKGITWHLADHSALHKAHATSITELDGDDIIRGHAFRTRYLQSNNYAEHYAFEPTSFYLNYYRGNDPDKWVHSLYPKKRLHYRNIWPQVDIHFYTQDGQLKYDFMIEPGGSVNTIQWTYDGAESFFIRDEKLVILTTMGAVYENKPFAYQVVQGEKVEVPCRYVIKDGIVSFEIGKYNKKQTLIIDPTLIFASYSGSTADNFGMTATYDNGGHLYAGGTAYSIGYPTTLGAYQTTTTTNGSSYGVTDAAISKFSPDGSTLVYSTYLGGGTATGGTETLHSLIVNDQDELYMFGVTSSSDFPTTSTAYDKTFNGGGFLGFMQNGTYFSAGTDIFVSKFNSTGTALIGSTFIGGSGNDGVNYNKNYLSGSYWISNYDSLQYNYGDQFRGEIMIDADGNCYVATTTKSSDFPVKNAMQPTFGGSQDAVIFKLDSKMENLIWSTYLGGTDKDAAYGLKIDKDRNVYVVGGTTSPDFLTVAGCLNTVYQGGKADGFIAKIDSSGSVLLKSTFIGTGQYDQVFFVELDSDEDVYVYGQTLDPTTYPVLNVAYSNPNSGQFITKLDNTLSTMIYSGLFGNGNGQANLSPSAFLVDICENIYISGWGGNIISGIPLTGMPVTPDAFQSSSGDGFNFYISVFETNFNSLIYGTYFGGTLSREHVDGGTSRFDKRGVIYQASCAGCGNYDDFPTTPGAWSQTNNSNNCNNGVFKLSIDLPFTEADFDFPLAICSGYDYQFINQSSPGVTYHWFFGDGNESFDSSPFHTYADTGLYTVTLIVVDTTYSTCIPTDTISKNIMIVQSPDNPDLATLDLCENTSIQIGIAPISGYQYSWSPVTGISNTNISNPFASPLVTTDYMLVIDNGYCLDTVYQTVIVNDQIPVPGFGFAATGGCASVSVALLNYAVNSTNVIYIINGDTLAPGDTLFNVAFNNSVNVTQVAFNGPCTSSLTQTFTAGGFSDYNDSLVMPNVFTPFVSLGLNDLFCPIGNNGVYCYEMIIYNRWGRSVFESSEDEPCWDGYVNHTYNAAVDGVYFYVLKYGGTEQHGFVHLIRH